MESRTCSLCGEEKPADMYPNLRGRINGRRCNACLARLRREERAARPPKPPRFTEKDRTSKRCNVCMIEKPVSEFYWNKRRWTSACRECVKAAQRARQAIAPEAHRAKVRARPSSQPKAQRAWREANKEHLAAYHKAWRDAKAKRNSGLREPRPRGYQRGYKPRPSTIEKRRATLAQRTEDERRQTAEKLSAAKRAMWESFSPEQRQSILDRGVRAGTRAFWEGKTWEERLAATAKMRHAGKNSYHTSIERAVGAVLSELGEPHESQKRLVDLRVDFYLPARNLVIECDGTYWHSKPGAAEKDAKRDARLQAAGYRVARLPEVDIRRDARAAVLAVLGIEFTKERNPTRMAISPNRIGQSMESITLTFPDQADTLTIWFRPDALTSKVQREADRIQRRMQVKRMHRDTAWKAALEAGEELPEDDDEALDAEDREATFSLFKALIVKWDLVADEPDNPYPPVLPVNAESLELLGWKTLSRMMREMAASISADPTKLKHTNNGSGPRELTVISRNQ